VHQHLYQGLSTADINVQQYLADLARDLNRSMLDNTPDRSVTVSAPDLIWPSEKVIALGLITTELVTNAIKYGDGPVLIHLALAENGSVTLVVEDRGRGFDVEFELGKGGGLGSKLITSLVRPDEGSVVIDRSVPYGKLIVTLGPDWRRSETL
jgi:two-component system, sensor histidine kinase PdtaS